ncbi:MAG: SRPBCC family protein [Bacteroidota bacterium]
MRVLKTVGAVIGILIALLLITGLFVPTDFGMERTTVIDASKEKIFPHIRYFEKRNAWYPWTKYDPDMKSTIEGTDGAVGAISTWEGNEKVGTGTQTITAIKENEEVLSHLHFMNPEEAEAESYLRLSDADEGTKVAWGFTFNVPYPFNAFMVFQDMDANLAEVKGDYDRGLAMLKSICEKEASIPTYRGYTIQTKEAPARTYVAIRKKMGMDKMEDFQDQQFPAISTVCQKKQLEMTGMPSGLFYEWDEENQQTDMAAAIPVKQGTKLKGSIQTIDLPAVKILQIDHYGEVDGTMEAHLAMDDYMKAYNLEPIMPVIEEYVTDTTQEPDTSKWLTRVVYQYKAKQVAEN